jgi:protein-disulfide isomerase
MSAQKKQGQKKPGQKKPAAATKPVPPGGRMSATAKAAQVRAEQQRAERRRLVIIGAVVLALVVAAGFAIQAWRDSTGATATPPEGATDDFGVLVGEASAPTTITIYEDFLCPVCGVFDEATAAPLEQAAEAGDVQLDLRIVAILDRASDDEYSTRSANAAAVVLDTAGLDAYLAFKGLLFENQPAEGGPGLSDDELVDLAVEAGAEEDAVRPGIEDKSFEQWTVNATDAMSQAGVTGTPTILVDGRQVEGASLQEVVDRTLAAAGATAGATG